MVAGVALADVVQQGAHHEQVGAVDPVDERRGVGGRLAEVPVDGEAVVGVALGQAPDVAPLGQDRLPEALLVEGLDDADRRAAGEAAARRTGAGPPRAHGVGIGRRGREPVEGARARCGRRGGPRPRPPAAPACGSAAGSAPAASATLPSRSTTPVATSRSFQRRRRNGPFERALDPRPELVARPRRWCGPRSTPPASGRRRRRSRAPRPPRPAPRASSRSPVRPVRRCSSTRAAQHDLVGRRRSPASSPASSGTSAASAHRMACTSRSPPRPVLEVGLEQERHLAGRGVAVLDAAVERVQPPLRPLPPQGEALRRRAPRRATRRRRCGGIDSTRVAVSRSSAASESVSFTVRTAWPSFTPWSQIGYQRPLGEARRPRCPAGAAGRGRCRSPATARPGRSRRPPPGPRRCPARRPTPRARVASRRRCRTALDRTRRLDTESSSSSGRRSSWGVMASRAGFERRSDTAARSRQRP